MNNETIQLTQREYKLFNEEITKREQQGHINGHSLIKIEAGPIAVQPNGDISFAVAYNSLQGLLLIMRAVHVYDCLDQLQGDLIKTEQP